LPEFAHCEEFVNPDLIAAGLSPFAPGLVAMQAGRLVLQRIHDLSRKEISFGFETTLSGKSYLRLLQDLKKRHYGIHVFYLWLPDENLAVQRVHDRKRQGGHFVPDADVRRRFRRGLRHFLLDYQRVIDDWILFDNSGAVPEVMAYGAGRQVSAVDSKQFSL